MAATALVKPDIKMALGPVALAKRVIMSQDGVFIEEGTGTKRQKMEIVLLWAHQHRVKWHATELGKYECRSSNGEFPDPTVEKPICTSCTTCPMASWYRPDGTKKHRSECQLKLELYFASPTRGDVFVMSIPPTSTEPTQLMYLKLIQQIEASKNTRKQLHPWDFTTTVSTAVVTDRGKRYRVIAFTDPKPNAKVKKANLPMYSLVIAQAQEFVNQRAPIRVAPQDGVTIEGK